MTSPHKNHHQLFHPHLILAHQYWEAIVRPGDLVIDATCGNGHDALKAAQLALSVQEGHLFAIDVQMQAIESAQKLLESSLSPECFKRVQFIHGCHSHFPSELSPGSVKLIIYNLGYLPGGDKSLTTMLDTSKQSLSAACELLCKGGAISIMFYPGHAEGKKEQETLLAHIALFDSQIWACCHHHWINRPNAPSLLLISKK